MATDDVIYDVVSPVGKLRAEQIAASSPRIPDINGKTICQVWNGRFQADKVFSVLSELLKKRFPSIRIIPWTDLPTVSFYRDQDKTLEDLREAYLRTGCDAVIASTGG